MSHDVFIKLLESARELRQQRVHRLTRLARVVGGRPRPRSETGIDVRAIRAATGRELPRVPIRPEDICL